MSNYTQTTFFAPKDALLSGNPAKIIYGAQVDPELAAIATAIATKYDSSSIASGPILFAAGSASLPSISFTGGTNNNTGIYLAGSNSLGFAAGGVSAGVISSGGAWSIPAPTSGVGLTVNGLANQYAGTFIGSSTSGQSLGLKVLGGTTSADFSFLAENQAGSAGFLAVYGDGEAVVAEPPAVTNATATIGSNTLHQVGYLDMPLNNKTASYTLVATDRGKGIYLTGTTASQTITVPHAVFPATGGAVSMVLNNSSQSWSIATDGTSTLRFGSLTGTRTLAPFGFITLVCLDGTNFWCWGSGIT